MTIKTLFGIVIFVALALSPLWALSLYIPTL